MRILIALTIALFSTSASAEDIRGSQDHPLVGRYEGAVIKNYTHKGYEETRLLTSVPSAQDKGKTESNSQALSGKYWRIAYDGPANRSALEVVRNLEKGLSAKGFQPVFGCRSPECGPGNGSKLWMAVTQGGSPGIVSNWDTSVYSVQKLSRPEGEVWVAMLAVEAKRSGELYPQLLLHVVEAAPMEEDKVVFVDANKMKQEIGASGKVALYGIYFEYDKAELMPTSDPTLEQISELLKSSPDLQLLVVGHTDNKGGFDYNIDLSKRRAAAVIEALTSRYGVAASRLTPFGVGMAAPVAPNETDEGRAKNRRVELVKR